MVSWQTWLKKTKDLIKNSLSSKKKSYKKLATRAIQKKSIAKNSSRNQSNTDFNFLNFAKSLIKTLILSPILIFSIFLIKTIGLNKLSNFLVSQGRIKLVGLSISIIFTIVGVRLAYIQIPFLRNLDSPEMVLAAKDNKFNDDTIIEATRGKIFIRDLAKNSTLLVAANRSVYKVVIYPKEMTEAIAAKRLDINSFISKVSAATNMNFFSVQDKVNDALAKYKMRGTRYYILIPEASSAQFKAISNLTSPPTNPKTDKPLYTSFRNYILAEPINSRVYPENSLLAATLGFVRENTASEEIWKIDTCHQMLQDNIDRQTESKDGYTTGQYGVERAYCSVLAGLNGKISFSTNGSSQYNETPTQEGSDIVLTIDKNLQAKAEEVLQKAVDANSNQNGKPIGGTILVSEISTGRILAEASYPFFDPNNVTPLDYEDGAIKNQASVAYDPGSVIKPLTIASARDVYEKGKVKVNGKRIGVPIDFTAEDVDEKGLVFTSTDGRESVVSNADNRSFKGVQSSLSDILRNSINTLIAKIQKDYMDTETTRYYFLEKFKLGDWSDSFLYTSEPPNTRNFDIDINSPFSYANMAFGQGFTTTPLNLVRAYSAIANKGCIVEPRIIESIGDKPFRQYEKDCTQILDSKVADEVVHMLQNTLEVGFGNGDQTKPSRAKMEKYTGGAKTGTAQIARPLTKKDKDGNLVKVPCNYTCNSNLGLYDHTFVGFAPASSPKIIVLVKLSQPKPGDRNYNYAEFSSAPFWKEMTEYSLGYLGVRPDR